MIDRFSDLFQSPLYENLFTAIGATFPIWFPIICALTWYELWMQSKQRQYIKEQGAMLLEIRIPREMLKSPAAMEVFIGTLHQTGVGNFFDVYFKGRVRPWFSLEVVSIDGSVHFFLWLHPKFRNFVESQLYAQFPNIEIHEVPDYSLAIHHDPEKYKFGWFGQLALTKPDAYPIKTYIDYGLDEDPKEEFKNDPIVPLLEFLGSMKKGEQAWVQILIQGHTKEDIKYGRINVKPDWKKDIERELKEILKKAVFKPEAKGEDGKDSMDPKYMSDGQKEAIKAIERTAAKLPFDTMIRLAYISEKDKFDAGNIGGLLSSFKQFSSQTLNGFKPDWNTGKNLDYPWQDPRGKKKIKNEKDILEAYKRRSFFNVPFKNFKGKPFILTNEELATLWHFPSSIVAATPTLSRLPSKKAEPPSNLPI